MKKIACVAFIGIVLVSQTFLSAAQPMDEYKPKGGSQDLFRKEIDRSGARDYLKMRKRQKLLEKMNKRPLERGPANRGSGLIVKTFSRGPAAVSPGRLLTKMS